MTLPDAPAPSPAEVPITVGTSVRLDARAKFLGRELIAGGAPWRLLRLSGSAVSLALRWREGGTVSAGQERFARTLTLQGLLHPSYPTPTNLDDIDVVIPLWRNARALDELLISLRGLRVIVVDDGSENAEEIAEVARRHGALLVRSERNEGPARARNLGAEAATREFIWFIDSDVLIDDASSVLASLRAQLSDPLVAAVAARVIGSNGRDRRSSFEHRFGPLDLGPTSALVVPRGSVSFVPAANLLIRRSAFGTGFDTTLRTGEDVDFVWRLHDAGWLVRYVADVQVRHRSRDSWQRWWTQRHGYGRSAGPLSRRHPERLSPVRVDVWTLGAWASVLAGRPKAALGVLGAARRSFLAQLPPSVENPERVADDIVTRGVVRAGGPLSRAVVRSYGPLLLVAALHPKFRRGALAVFAAGTAWRWHDRSGPFDVRDVPLAIADDAAYATGVWRGALEARSWRAVVPRVDLATEGLRAVLRGATTKPPPDPLGTGRRFDPSI